ncbi:DUF819 family protein [Flexibacterium corallicola]|uniref:DUF819 family protein n=1 Tax=Flexibacterium corallicola TaxID=3037259 RepID=UPI00286F4F3E|nr:DUF819 family protein [Pseudovibrio sp. M1P-2-3]
MLFILLLLILPALIIILAQKVPILDRIGVVPLTFALGFVIAALVEPSSLGDEQSLMNMRTSLAEVSVALALPLILFASNLRRAFSEAGGALLAMATAALSVALVSFVGVLFFSGQIDQIWQVSGMAVGAYTGSGVNMGAIKTAINGNEEVFLTMVTYDFIFSAIYMLVILFFGQRIAGLILKPYEPKGSHGEEGLSGMEHMADETAHGYKLLLKLAMLPETFLSLACTALVVAASVAISKMFPESLSSIVTILAISTLGIAGSMVPQLHKIKTSFHLGMYLILVFCLTTATMLDWSVFTNINWSLGGYFALILIGSMFLQAFLCWLFKVDRDTYLIASGASIMSVPFIPLIAGALKNRELLIPGIAIAVLGYAFGNYLGVLVATASRSIVGG